jgi:hypothetical protein
LHSSTQKEAFSFKEEKIGSFDLVFGAADSLFFY